MTWLQRIIAWAAAHPPEAAPLVEGVDVSGWQDPELWDLTDAKPGFAIVKVSQGHSHRSALATAHAEALTAAGVPVGAYHYGDLRADRRKNPSGQADHAVRCLTRAGLTPGAPMMAGGRALPGLWLDIEWEAGVAIQGDELDWCHRWVERVEALTGQTPGIYTLASYWSGPLRKTDSLARCPLWLAGLGGLPRGDGPAPTLRQVESAKRYARVAEVWRPAIVQWAGSSGRAPYYAGGTRPIDRDVLLPEVPRAVV